MPTSAPDSYRKLPGSGGSVIYRQTLWLAGDHVLSVGSSLIGERYKRFYFADVEAFVWRRTQVLWIRLAVWLVLALGTAAIGLAVDPPGRFIFFGIGGFLFLPLVWEIVRGPTAACFVKTAVQFERLHALSRESDLRRFLAEVRPLIAAKQTPPSPFATS